MTELKPCPFCGGEAYIAEHSYKCLGVTYYCVRCGECQTETFEYPTEAVAIEMWNRRENDE